MDKKEPNPAQTARVARMREAASSGAQARSEAAAHDVAVRKNMERLKALRLAKEAAEPPPEKPAPKKAAAKKASAKKSAGKLSDFIRDQQASGRRT